MFLSNTLLSAVALTALSIFLIVFASRELAREHGSDIRVIWYFFGLATTISLILCNWARVSGAIDKEGNFQGALGNLLSFLLKASLDLQGSMLLVLAIVAVILVPQIISCFFSGLAGCGSAPMFADSSLWLIAWGTIKSMAVAAGVALVVPTYAYMYRWTESSAQFAQGMALFALMLLSLAFITTYLYRDLLQVPSFIKKRTPRKIRWAVLRSRRWLSRHDTPTIRQKESQDSSQ